MEIVRKSSHHERSGLNIAGHEVLNVLLPRRWVVKRGFAWAARFRGLARDYERLAETLTALQYLAFAILMLANLARQLTQI